MSRPPTFLRLRLELAARLAAARAQAECEAGRYAAAERLARRGLAMAAQIPGDANPLRTRLWNTRGMAAKYRQRFAAAACAYARVRALLEARGTPATEDWATLYHNLGGLEHARGNHAAAEPLARRSVELRGRALGATHPDVGRDQAALAAILDGRGLHADAERLHREALGIFARHRRSWRRWSLEREVAATLLNLAACLHARGRTAEAQAMGERAVAKCRQVLGAGHPESQIARANLEVIRAAAR